MARSAITPGRVDHDAGFTLIEVVVALFLLGVVATAGLTFFFRGMQNASHLQRTQAAVAVATQAMEQVRSVTPRVADVVTSTSGLVIGRSKSDVQASWLAAAPADTAESTPVWDAAAATRTKVALPVTYTTTVSDESYTVTTLIGTCFRAKTASASSQTCTKVDPGSAAKLFRVTIVVTWKPGKTGQCGASVCDYRLSTLIDPTLDANWNLTAKPVAYDDESTTTTAAAGDVSNTLANDVMGFVPAGVNPTTITVAPLIGTQLPSPAVPRSGGSATAPATESGITSLKYRLKECG